MKESSHGEFDSLFRHLSLRLSQSFLFHTLLKDRGSELLLLIDILLLITRNVICNNYYESLAFAAS